MSDKPREWPYNAKHARDIAAELTQESMRELEPLLTEERIFTETERDLRLKRAYINLTKILRHLESVGAQTRPC